MALKLLLHTSSSKEVFNGSPKQTTHHPDGNHSYPNPPWNDTAQLFSKNWERLSPYSRQAITEVHPLPF
jgi:hypothetical protein